MTRRSAGGRLPWGNSNSMYGSGSSGLPRLALMALILVALVAIGLFVFLRACGGNECTREYCETSRDVVAPEGYELVSKLFELNKDFGEIPPGNDIGIQVPLKEPTTDNRNLSFYRYVEDSKAWEPVAAATLDPQGTQVSGILKEAPPVLAVLRRLTQVGNVVAYLENGAQLHPQALPLVTIVHTLDFKPASDGAIEGKLTPLTLDPRIAHYPTISANAADKANILVEAILAGGTSRSSHVQQIVAKLAETKAAGIDIAYTDLRADQRGSFTLFIAELGGALHAQNKTLTLTLPAPIRVQDRIDEGAYDWAELAKSADILQVTPFRDQSTYRRDVPEILQYLTGRVSNTKLVFTVTPYATEKSSEGLRRLTLTDAMSIATRMGVSTSARIETNSNVEIIAHNINKSENLSGITWDTNTACVGFTYKDNGNRTVWIENFFSVGFKLELASKFNLGGIAIEDASNNEYLGNIWPALEPFISSGQPVLMQPNGNDLIPKFRPSSPNGGSIEGGPLAPRGFVKWVTPSEPGTHRVTIQLSDGVALFESEIAVNVQPRESKTPVAGTTPASGTG